MSQHGYNEAIESFLHSGKSRYEALDEKDAIQLSTLCFSALDSDMAHEITVEILSCNEALMSLLQQQRWCAFNSEFNKQLSEYPWLRDLIQEDLDNGYAMK